MSTPLIDEHGPAVTRLPVDIIQYHGYAALICTFDESGWIRMGRSTNAFVGHHFDRSCYAYRQRIDTLCRNWRDAGGLSPDGPTFPGHLYNPMYFLTFGHADSVGLVLIDDIDAMMEISADIDSPVEQIQLAFCPTLESLGLAETWPFADLHDLFDAPAADQPPTGLRRHGVQASAPLLMWTKLKLSGIGMLGEGLLVEQTAYQAIAARMLDVIGRLRDDHARLAGPDAEPLYTIDDLHPNHLQVAVLDSQGAEEISLLVFCRNYTVGISLLTAVRALTFGDLFKQNPFVRERLAASETHRAILAACRPVGSASEPEIEGLSDNHIISKTYTTLGVDYDTFNQAPECSTPPISHGFVLVYPHFDINPGHLGEIERKLVALFERSSSAPSEGLSAIKPRVIGKNNQLHRFLVGRNDYLMELHTLAASEDVSALSVNDYFRLMRMIYESSGCTSAKGERETGLLDSSTSIVVPFPRLLGPDGADSMLETVGARHRSIIPLLHSVSQAVAASFPPATYLSSVSTLKQPADYLRELYLPASLRRTIRYFYQDFIHCLSDPLLFEGVLDLYDTFCALNHLLRDVLAESIGAVAEQRGVLTAADLAELEGLLAALHNAMTHRMAFSMPQWEARDMAVDFRGGLNCIVAAADVPMKCGLGVLRRLAFARPTADAAPANRPMRPPPRTNVGAVTRISFNPTAVVTSLAAGEAQGIWLGHIAMDVAHLVNVFEYPMYTHEVCHLILRSTPAWENLIAGMKAIVVGKSSRPSDKASQDIHVGLEEIAVDMLTFLFAFAPDIALFRRYLVIRFNSHPAVFGIPREKCLSRFIEILLRVFFVGDPFQGSSKSFDWPAGAVDKLRYAPSHDEARRRFTAMADELGPLFREYAYFCMSGDDKQDFDDTLVSAFDYVFPVYRRCTDRIWAYVVRVFQGACRIVGAPPWTLPREHREEVESIIHSCIERGMPFSRSTYLFGAKDGLPPSSEVFDQFFIVNRVLRAYLERLLAPIDTTSHVHVPRPDPERRLDLRPAARRQGKYGSILLDSLRPGVVCYEPELRRENLCRQIAVLKTLWDQSSTLRGRRFLDLLSHKAEVTRAAPA